MRYIKYILIIFSVFLSGCLSKEERKARQENGFDISGDYKTVEDVEDPSEVQLEFTIINQNVKHDIFVQLNRISPLTMEEKEFLSELAKDHGVSVETLTAQPFPKTFGGESGLLDLDGGDNISDDFGKTSKFNVCADNPPKYESKKVVEDAKNVKLRISYCLSGVIEKESKNRIDGELSLDASYSYDLKDKDKDGGFGVSSHDKDVILHFKAEKINGGATSEQTDAGVADAGGEADAGETDAGETDAGVADAGGETDAGETDVGSGTGS